MITCWLTIAAVFIVTLVCACDVSYATGRRVTRREATESAREAVLEAMTRERAQYEESEWWKRAELPNMTNLTARWDGMAYAGEVVEKMREE